MASSPRPSLGNVRSDMDIAYPEHLSRLHRHSILTEYPKAYLNPKKVTRNRRGNRYRTQPVTFDEIQEVDEEAMVGDNQGMDEMDRPSAAAISTSELQLNFYRFSKSLNSKRKKLDTSHVEPVLNPTEASDALKSNGEQSVPESFPQNSLSWTDYTREGSV